MVKSPDTAKPAKTAVIPSMMLLEMSIVYEIQHFLC